ncbi:MAG: 50S ribosome-binding GTPase [Candidatus Moduliflexus flocculans]|nr:50S ribosome-binding GTPase [Candidatus Moduliflexus flocculans]
MTHSKSSLSRSCRRHRRCGPRRNETGNGSQADSGTHPPRLEKDLKAINKSRQQRRGKREKTALPVISIVGYTNAAGKSTLINTLTKSSVLVEDKLFATLG